MEIGRAEVKKYHLFACVKYNSQGVDDYQQSFETLKEARDYYVSTLLKYYDTAEIMETKPDGSLVKNSSFWNKETGWVNAIS